VPAFTEEFLTGFQRQFPMLTGYEWSDAQFVAFNMAWLAVFVLAGLGVYRRMQLAYLVVLFLALAGGVGNGAGHLLLSVTQRKVFPRSGHGSPFPAGGYRVAYEAVRRSKSQARTGMNHGCHHAGWASWIFRRAPRSS
jgi:hypothetical protein